MSTNEYHYREKISYDDRWVKKIVSEQWGSTKIVSKDKFYNTLTLPGFIAEDNGNPVGLILYGIENQQCEIVALYSAQEGKGIGSKLIQFVRDSAKQNHCSRIWLQTTNDNTQALKFYQKRGFTLSALRPNAIEAQRKLKPIPQLGKDGIPIRDEIELEILL